MARGAPERGPPPLVGHVSIGGGRVFLQVLVILGATNHHAEVVAGGGRGRFGVVLSHALQTKEVGLLGPGFTAVDCCEVVTDELQAEFIYEHVEGAKAVAGTRVRSVGIHDDVGVVAGPNEKLHEEPARPVVVASRLVQACNLVFLVHGSHVPETRGKVSATNHHAEVVAGGGRGTFGVVLSHALQTKEVGLLGPGFTAVDCCEVVTDELQAEFIYEHVEGAKAVAGTRVRSVGIHDDVGIVAGPNEKLHEEPARPVVVASRLVQA